MKLRTHTLPALLALGTVILSAPRVSAQTDYYNTDRGRPVQVEDAYVTERYGMELKLAPVRLERERGGIYSWGVDPEIAYGVLPRTQVEIGLPLVFVYQGYTYWVFRRRLAETHLPEAHVVSPAVASR